MLIVSHNLDSFLILYINGNIVRVAVYISILDNEGQETSKDIFLTFV